MELDQVYRAPAGDSAPPAPTPAPAAAKKRLHARLVLLAVGLFCSGAGHVAWGYLGRGVAWYLLGLSVAPVTIFYPAVTVPVAVVVHVGRMTDLAWLLWRREPQTKRPVAWALAAIGVALTISLVQRDSFVESFHTPTTSMAPNLLIGDRFTVYKAAYGLRLFGMAVTGPSLPERGDVVAHANEQGTLWVKRVIGLPGDELEFRESNIVVNGEVLSQTVLAAAQITDLDPRDRRTVLAGTIVEEKLAGRHYRLFLYDVGTDPAVAPLRVPEGHVYLLGDNRRNTHDSRFYGAVPVERLRGKVTGIYWPANAQGNLDRLGPVE
jgi:signal peptidase I